MKWTASGEVVDDSFETAKAATKAWLKETPEGRDFRDHYITDANIDKLRKQIEFHNLPVDFQSLTFAFTILRDSGQLSTEQEEEAAKQASAPDVERDRNGHPLSASQLEWRAFAAWANDPNTTSAMIAERRRTSRSFAKFYSECMKAERTVPIDGAVPEPETLGTSTSERAELEAFAELFLHAPASSLRPIGGYVTLGTTRYLHSVFVKLVDRCAECKLI